MLRATPMTAKEAHQYLSLRPNIKFRDNINVNNKVSLEKFVEALLLDYTLKHQTVTTAHEETQCRSGARRTLSDLTKLCRHYYPNDKVCLEKVKNILKDLVNTNVISTSICGQIKERVFFTRGAGRNTIHNTENRDEYGWVFNLKTKTRIPKPFQ